MTNRPVIILGAGGHAKVLFEALRLSGRVILGFVTPDLEVGAGFCGSTVLGDDSIILNYSANEVDLVNGVGALPGKNLRWKLTSSMREKGYHFTVVIHPNAVVASDVVLKEGAQVMAGVVIQPGTTIGKNTIINTGSIIDHDCIIAENCHVAPSVVCSGDVNIGKNVHIGTGARIIQGINIGEGCVIAAGSTIYKDVPANMLVKQQNTEMNLVEV
jgi:sugar O-acyltransferase (sialic acid O-acetyltransferase NeuD family)